MIPTIDASHTTRRNRLMKKLGDHEYRHAYADEHLNLTVSTQIKVLREQRKMNQGELAEAIGTKQAGVSRLESVDYSKWSISTLRKIAKAFDVRLKVTFEEFGTLWQEVVSSDRRSLERAKFQDDPGCLTTKPNISVGDLGTDYFSIMSIDKAQTPWHEINVPADNVISIDRQERLADSGTIRRAV